MFEDNSGSNFDYWQIKAGAIRKKVSEDTKGAKIRSYQIGDVKGTVCELVHAKLTGKITNVYSSHFEMSDGRQANSLNVVVNDKIVLSMSEDSQYEKSFLSKLLGVDLSKDITIAPYEFETKEGRKMVGVSLVQDNEKLTDQFFAYDEKKKEYKSLIKGFEKPTIKDFDKLKDSEKKIAIEDFKHEMKKLAIRIRDYVLEEYNKKREAIDVVTNGEPFLEEDEPIDVTDIPF